MKKNSEMEEEILTGREHALFLWTDLNYFRQTIIRQTGNFIRDATHYDYDERVEEVGSAEMR